MLIGVHIFERRETIAQKERLIFLARHFQACFRTLQVARGTVEIFFGVAGGEV